MQMQDKVIAVEDYEKERRISRPYNYVNIDFFAQLPVIGTNGEHYPEAIIKADPDVIMMSCYGDSDADKLQKATGIPVVLVPGSDKMMDDGAYETVRIMGEVYGKEERADELTDYMDRIKADLKKRTDNVREENKPSVYIGGVSFKGMHGLEGTEAYYDPLEVVRARNLANETGQQGPFNVDKEQILLWNPDIIFVDYNGLPLIQEDFKTNPQYYRQLSAVQNGQIYAQISFRSSASNLEMALINTYYAGSILYPDKFSDIDLEEKTNEIFTMLLGTEFYHILAENGYEFRKIQMEEE